MLSKELVGVKILPNELRRVKRESEAAEYEQTNGFKLSSPTPLERKAQVNNQSNGLLNWIIIIIRSKYAEIPHFDYYRLSATHAE